MIFGAEFKGDKSFDAVLDQNETLDVGLEGDKFFDVEFGEAKPINVEFEEGKTDFNSDFGEMYGLHIDESESIIALSIDGHELTYIKANGSIHTITIPDDNTTYSLGTDEVTGLTKIYATTGNAEDGTMTQKAITTELRKKVSVSVDDAQKSLVFSTN